MSSVVISGNTSGTITLDAPNVAGTTVLTLPSANGTVLTSASSVASSQLPAGSVVQVVNATYTGIVSCASNSFVDTGLSASITPSSSSNKILVLVSLQFFVDTAGGNLGAQILRGSSTSVVSQDYLAYGSAGGFMSNTFMQGLDSPSTTSSTTYKVQFKRRSGSGTIFAQYADANGTGLSSITLLEIKG